MQYGKVEFCILSYVTAMTLRHTLNRQAPTVLRLLLTGLTVAMTEAKIETAGAPAPALVQGTSGARPHGIEEGMAAGTVGAEAGIGLSGASAKAGAGAGTVGKRAAAAEIGSFAAAETNEAAAVAGIGERDAPAPALARIRAPGEET